jgi:hypothetical protein
MSDEPTDDPNSWKHFSKCQPTQNAMKPWNENDNSEEKCPRTIAIKSAAVLMACYRAADFHAPEAFASVMVDVLCDYPQWVVERICDPKMGLPSRLKFPPMIAEIHEAAKGLLPPKMPHDDYASIVRERRRLQLLEREPDPPEVRKAAADRVRAMFGLDKDEARKPLSPVEHKAAEDRLAAATADKSRIEISQALRDQLASKRNDDPPMF